MVVIDVAMTETARLAHYVLPAASQFEKPEATFFNLEFPHNTFHLRHPLLEPLPGTLPEPEIWARLVRALGVVDDADLEPLREAADARTGGVRAGVPRSGQRQPRDGAGAAVRSLRDAGPDAARRPQGCRGAVGAGAEDGDDLSRSGAPGRPCRRQRALRGDPAEPLGCDVHRARVRGRLRADRPRGSQDRVGDARNARRDRPIGRRADRR